MEHPLAERSEIIYRKHPKKDWQFWNLVYSRWSRSSMYNEGDTYYGETPGVVISWIKTWCEPEKG